MLAKVQSFVVSGLQAYPVSAEVDVSHGLPSITIVGLPDNAVKESKERVRSAIKNSGYKFPAERITVNLSPADLKKGGAFCDLAIALGILAATGQIDSSLLEKYVILGELSLDGSLQPVKGSITVAMALKKKTEKFLGIVLPLANAREAAMVDEIGIYPVKNLNQAVQFLKDPAFLKPYILDKGSIRAEINHYEIDFSEVKGQAQIKRGLEVASAGGHNVLLVGTQYNRWSLRWWLYYLRRVGKSLIFCLTVYH